LRFALRTRAEFVLENLALRQQLTNLRLAPFGLFSLAYDCAGQTCLSSSSQTPSFVGTRLASAFSGVGSHVRTLRRKTRSPRSPPSDITPLPARSEFQDEQPHKQTVRAYHPLNPMALWLRLDGAAYRCNSKQRNTPT
jgi:hypothetical protein